MNCNSAACSMVDWFAPCLFSLSHNFMLSVGFLEERNRFLAERCNRLSNAISKCDELSEILNKLCTLAQEQRESMQLLKIKCKEMVDNIEKSKCAFYCASKTFKLLAET